MTEHVDDVDFDLHGFVGIRLTAPSAAEVAMVERQVGPLQGKLERAPNIVIEFVDRLDVRQPLRLIGDNDAAFSDRDFIVLRGRHKARVRVALPLDQVGSECRIVCERGVPAIPMLIPVVNMVALSLGIVPVHASAFVYRGTGVLATGWAKGGKTETLLSFMAQGATYVGDEWIYVTADGRMYGIPEPIKIWNWHLAELGAYRRRVSRSDRIRLGALDRTAGASAWLGSWGSRLPPGRLASRAAPLLRSQAYVHLPPHQLFGAARCETSSSLDRLVLVAARDAPGITVEPASADEVTDRMLASNEHERLDFRAAYLKYRYAFPDRRSPLIEDASTIERDALRIAFRGRPTWVVEHPYPVSIPDLFHAVWPVIRGDDDGPPASA